MDSELMALQNYSKGIVFYFYFFLNCSNLLLKPFLSIQFIAINTFRMLCKHYHIFKKLLSSQIETLYLLRNDTALHPLPQALVISCFNYSIKPQLKLFRDFKQRF